MWVCQESGDTGGVGKQAGSLVCLRHTVRHVFKLVSHSILFYFEITNLISDSSKCWDYEHMPPYPVCILYRYYYFLRHYVLGLQV